MESCPHAQCSFWGCIKIKNTWVEKKLAQINYDVDKSMGDSNQD